jgi:hypothetical protein
MRLAEPDTHHVTRRIAEGLLPSDQVDAFGRAEAERVQRPAGAGPSVPDLDIAGATRDLRRPLHDVRTCPGGRSSC